jgi:transcriptional regulator with XRE-family HTH domain
MKSLSRIKGLAKESGRTMSYLCQKMGVARVYFNDIEKSGREIPSEKLAIIADALDTTVDYLLGNTDKKEKPTVKDDGLSDGERAWLELYHKLSGETREILIGAMQSYDQLSEERKSLALQMLRIALGVQ